MDDPADGRYPRAPELEDLVELCRRLNQAEARYLLIGGFAVIFHGCGNYTKKRARGIREAGSGRAEASLASERVVGRRLPSANHIWAELNAFETLRTAVL